MSTDAARTLAAALDRLGAGHLVVVTGAGISLASGIPTFRGDDPGAVWRSDLVEKGTYDYFRRDPVDSWRWSMKLFERARDARPNAGHRAVAALERWHRGRGGRTTLVTQNVDTLHEQAGSGDVVKVHGTLDRVRCASPLGCAHGAPDGSIPLADVDFGPFLAQPSLDTLPRCRSCGDLVRQHVLWFDEYYADHADYQWPRVQAASRDMDLLLFVGTSFAVGVTEVFLHTGLFGKVATYSVDPSAEAPYPGVHDLRARAEELLPAVCHRLGAEL